MLSGARTGLNLPRTSGRPSTGQIAAGAAAIAVAGLAGASLALVPPELAVAALAALAIALAAAVHPPLAAYAILGLTPLVAGIDRGLAIPLLRPSEALALLVGCGVAVGLAGRALSGQPLGFQLRFGRLDAAILFLLLAGSVLPVLWMIARDRPLTQDDLLHPLHLAKYYGIFLLVRASVRTERQVSVALWVAMASAALVAIVAILQSLQLFGVDALLARWYAPFGDVGLVQNQRGTSTLASSIAVADIMVYSLAIAAAWLVRGARHRTVLTALAALFVFGTVASGQFSAFIAMGVGVGVIGLLTGRLGRIAARLVPVLVVAGIALWPVIAERLRGFSGPEGIPPSWAGRLENLNTYFWPELWKDLNWLTGVRPSARVPAPESWREYVFIESGHTWLLWTGGVLFLIAFFVFLWAALRTLAPIARRRLDAIGVAGIAAFTALTVIAVLMIVDPHLTLRGSADLAFSLIALALTRPRNGPDEAPS